MARRHRLVRYAAAAYKPQCPVSAPIHCTGKHARSLPRARAAKAPALPSRLEDPMFHGLVVVLLGLIPTAPAQDGKDLVAYVEKLGGTAKQVVYYDTDGKKIEKGLYLVDLKGKKVSDEDVRQLARMKGLHNLDLSFTQVTDKGVEHLGGVQELNGLDLVGTRVTDAVIPHLRKPPGLHYLN